MPMSHDELRAAYDRLQEQAVHLEEENARQQKQLQEYEQRLAEAQAEIAELKRQLFGPKADRLSPEQQKQLDALGQDLDEHLKRPEPDGIEVLVDDAATARPRRARRVRHPLPAHLETETITLEPEGITLEPNPTACPRCARVPRRIGEEVTEEIDLVPAKLIRRRIVRPKYACGCDEHSVAIAPLPPRLIPQSRLGLGLAVHIVLARFDDHLSFYRLEQQFRERYGVAIPRQQMVQWAEHIATWLRPLYEAVWKAMRTGDYMQIDETPVRVLDPEVKGKAARGYLWFYAVPGGDVILEFDRSRGQEPVRERLKAFTGTIQTDAYDVYDAVRRRRDGLMRIGCLAHARRKFYKAVRENSALAVWFIGQIRLLYRIEDEARGLPPAERHALRQAKAPQIWEELKKKAEELRPILLPQSTLGNAVGYFLDEYDFLIGYLRDGRFEIDNNLVENAIRPTAVGRKRWLFIGHPDAAWRSAVIYSLLQSCRRRGINPHEYLTDVLGRLPTVTVSQIGPLLPANWKPRSPDTS
jgi:transposase